MSVQGLEVWAGKFIESSPLSWLNGSKIGIDASFYLNQILNQNTEEPLKVALAGLPFTFEARVQEDIDAAKEQNIDLVFVFDGLPFVNKRLSGSDTEKTRRSHDLGWTHYLGGDAKGPIAEFGRADYPIDLVMSQFQKLLFSNQVEFLVAPFSALAMLAYLYHHHGRPIDAVMASTDALLFDIDKVILTIDNKYSNFSWLERSKCLQAAGCDDLNLFKESQLLLGSVFLPPLPTLTRLPNASIKDVLNMVGRNRIIDMLRQLPGEESADYVERYKKAAMTIQYHVIMADDGSVHPMQWHKAPSDVHAFVGQRLPDEVFFYMSKGLISPQVPNWLATSIDIPLPGGIIDTEPVRRFLTTELNPIRLQSIKLLAESLHYWYQNRQITIRDWLGREQTQSIKETGPLKDKMYTWKVTDSLLSSSVSYDGGRHPSMLGCLRACKSKDWAARSVLKGRVPHPALRSVSEVVANLFFRFLHLRGYLDDKHELTRWGLVLETVLAALDGGSRKEEQAVLLVELLRLGVLNTSSPIGVAVSATDRLADTKKPVNLLAKIACVGRLKHTAVGYAGPLDRQLLTFAGQITVLRTCLRGLIESIVVTMFINGDVSRARDDWAKIAISLPFASDNGAGLGICVKTYLEALRDNVKDAKDTAEVKKQIKSQDGKYAYFLKLENGTLDRSLESAWRLFDAVRAGVKAGGNELKEGGAFEETGRWLESRR